MPGINHGVPMAAKELFFERISKNLEAKADKVKTIQAIYEFNITDENQVYSLDFTKDSNFVTEGSTGNAKCTISIKGEDLAALVDKKLNPQMAFMTGKLKIKGDMGLALKLGTIL